MTNLFIFSNDLRLEDNQALYEASINSKTLQAVFIFSPNKWDTHNESHLKIKFQIKNLEILKKELQNLNINLKILFSDKIEDEPKVITQEALRVKANNVFINSEYGVNEKKRDEELNKLLEKENIALKQYDSSIINPNKLVTGSGTFFKVFTPYSKSFRNELNQDYLNLFPAPKKQQNMLSDSDTIPEYQLKDEFKESALTAYEPGEKAAINSLENFIENKINNYKVERDFPSKDSTSKLSIYLSSGIISAKTCVANLLAKSEDLPGSGEYSWFNEIIWREFYKYIIFHYPRVSMRKSFNEKYDALQWRDSKEDF